MIILKNGRYLSAEGKFVKGDIHIEDGKIKSINEQDGSLDSGSVGTGAHIYDLEDKRVIPGLIDMHTHGAIGYDVSIATPEEICQLTRYYSDRGITSFFPTTITAARGDIKSALRNIKAASKMDCGGASIEGVHIEGPFINAAKKGAHDPNWITTPKKSDYDEYREIMGDLRIHLTVAPEIEGGLEFIDYVVKNDATVGIGHTDTDYNRALEGIRAGASIFTHLFNAMVGIHHRNPGTVGAALTGDAFVEIIGDGMHIHPAVVNIAINAKGPKGVVLVTDSMHAAGLDWGEYDFGGFKILIEGGVAKHEDGTLAGSIISLMDAVKNAMEFSGVSLEDAVAMATINPARVLGLDDKLGSIELGKRGDLVVLDEDLKAHMVFCRGERVK
ncbi:MAG TPA: N-acetylglucosamine-6-phosphate deacetylase [Clostridia bacterium]|nr:N-acetylglucosamine-6-phosphate deacetylase [Clostridia bacterium]